MANNAAWYRKIAHLTKEIADNCGGAITITRTELKEEIIRMDPEFVDCPQVVWDHLTVSLRQVGLVSSNCDGFADQVLIIHDQDMPKAVAQAHCRDFGLKTLFSPEPVLAMSS